MVSWPGVVIEEEEEHDGAPAARHRQTHRRQPQRACKQRAERLSVGGRVVKRVVGGVDGRGCVFFCVCRALIHHHHAHFERVGRRLCGHWCTWRSAAMPHLCCVSLSLPDCCAPTAAAWLQPPGGVVGCAPLCVLFFAMFLCVSNRSGGVSHLFSQQFYALWARLLAMMTNAQRRCRTRSKFAPRPTNGRALPIWHSLRTLFIPILSCLSWARLCSKECVGSSLGKITAKNTHSRQAQNPHWDLVQRTGEHGGTGVPARLVVAAVAQEKHLQSRAGVCWWTARTCLLCLQLEMPAS